MRKAVLPKIPKKISGKSLIFQGAWPFCGMWLRFYYSIAHLLSRQFA